MFAKEDTLKKSAYTLVELIVTIVIIAVLATAAIPMFSKALETTKGSEARAALEQIRAGERVYRFKEGYYYPSPPGEADAADIREYLKLNLDEKHWTYKVRTSDGNNFIATARRKAGAHATTTITLTQDGEFAGDWPL